MKIWMAYIWNLYEIFMPSRGPLRTLLAPGEQQGSIVVFLAQMGDQVLAHHPAQRVLQLHRLDKQVVLGIKLRRAHGRFEIEAQPFLDAAHSGALGQIEEENQIKYDRRRQDRVAAEEIDLDLHRIAQPAEDVNVVPSFFVIPARWIVNDADLVVNVPVQVGIQLWLENVFEHAEFGFFLRLERFG